MTPTHPTLRDTPHPPHLLSPQVFFRAFSATQTHKSRVPQAGNGSSLAKSVPRANCLGSLPAPKENLACGKGTKRSHTANEYPPWRHHAFLAFPTGPHSQAPACPGACWNGAQRPEQVVGYCPKHRGKSQIIDPPNDPNSQKVLLDRTDEEQRASLSGKFIAARYEQSLPFPKQIIL